MGGARSNSRELALGTNKVSVSSVIHSFQTPIIMGTDAGAERSVA